MIGPEDFNWDEAMEKADGLSLEGEENASLEGDDGVDPYNTAGDIETPDDLKNETDAHRALGEGLDEAA